MAASRQHLDNNCRDAAKIVHGPAAEIEQTGSRDDRVQSWPHPRVGFDSQRLKSAGPAGCGSDELTDPALLHFNQCARKGSPIEKGSGQVICNSPGHGLVGDADSVGDGSACGALIDHSTQPFLRSRVSAPPVDAQSPLRRSMPARSSGCRPNALFGAGPSRDSYRRTVSPCLLNETTDAHGARKGAGHRTAHHPGRRLHQRSPVHRRVPREGGAPTSVTSSSPRT